MKSIQYFASILSFVITYSVFAQNNPSLETIKVSDHIYMLMGSGGNIGLSVGDDGVLVIDDQFPQTTPQIIEAVKNLSDKPVRFLANTHHHGDHSGGNANLEKIGATIVAHDNVRKRLAANSNEGLPILTFDDGMNIYINGERVMLFHIENAHTDGDVMLYFTESNVLHTGDVYVKNAYPFIDLSSKGNLEGFINGAKKVLMIIDDDTKIIPGHGDLSNKAEYESFLKMLEKLKARVLSEIAKGKTEQEITNDTAITKEYDDLGYGKGFINSARIRQSLYTCLKK